MRAAASGLSAGQWVAATQRGAWGGTPGSAGGPSAADGAIEAMIEAVPAAAARSGRLSVDVDSESEAGLDSQGLPVDVEADSDGAWRRYPPETTALHADDLFVPHAQQGASAALPETVLTTTGGGGGRPRASTSFDSDREGGDSVDGGEGDSGLDDITGMISAILHPRTRTAAAGGGQDQLPATRDWLAESAGAAPEEGASAVLDRPSQGNPLSAFAEDAMRADEEELRQAEAMYSRRNELVAELEELEAAIADADASAARLPRGPDPSGAVMALELHRRRLHADASATREALLSLDTLIREAEELADQAGY